MFVAKVGAWLAAILVLVLEVAANRIPFKCDDSIQCDPANHNGCKYKWHAEKSNATHGHWTVKCATTSDCTQGSSVAVGSIECGDDQSCCCSPDQVKASPNCEKHIKNTEGKDGLTKIFCSRWENEKKAICTKEPFPIEHKGDASALAPLMLALVFGVALCMANLPRQA